MDERIKIDELFYKQFKKDQTKFTGKDIRYFGDNCMYAGEKYILNILEIAFATQIAENKRVNPQEIKKFIEDMREDIDQ